MAGVNNHEFVGENGPLNPSHLDGLEASVTPEASVAQAQVTPLDAPPQQQEIPVQEDPLMIPQGVPMEVVMTALVNTINRQNELIREQNRRIQAIEDSCTASRVSRNTRRRRSPTPENHRSQLRSRSPKPAPRRNVERPLSPIRENPQRKNRSPPQRNNRTPPPRNNHSPPRRNNRIPPRNGGGNARHSPRRESSGSGDERHRGPLSRRIMDIPLPRGLDKPPSLNKYDGTTDPDEHIQSVETALDYRNLRGAIKCKLFLLSLIRGASTWWRNLPPGSIDSWEELCRMFTPHFTTSRRHPKTVANLKEIIQGPEESLRSYIERFNKVSVEILSEISNAEFKSAGIRFPKQLPAKPNVDKKKFYRFHKSYGHVTDDCVHLKDAIEILIQKGYARQYNVEDDNRAIGGVVLAISRPEDFLPLPNNEEKEALDYLSAHLDGSWENFPGAQVISGGGINPVTIGSIKRKFDELEKASPVGEIKITKVKESSVPLAFYREEVPGGIAKLSNSLARLFKVLQLTEKNLVPYVGSDLQGFNGSTTKPWGYVDLIVTFGENKAMKSVKVKFLVVDCPSLYNCIIG
ncbi:hypothetical protein TSUD_271980 [Trifolium subterraneum]|uniref:Retrotransposon gag domain-containing protein n=1 Tax=Trifolium subterraneum TaxID=3900 RepID=A0A2Z6PB57_TRISU|nr:hypothetical protein TSUD_271980 [Trifolium subterraneum]